MCYGLGPSMMDRRVQCNNVVEAWPVQIALEHRVEDSKSEEAAMPSCNQKLDQVLGVTRKKKAASWSGGNKSCIMCR